MSSCFTSRALQSPTPPALRTELRTGVAACTPMATPADEFGGKSVDFRDAFFNNIHGGHATPAGSAAKAAGGGVRSPVPGGIACGGAGGVSDSWRGANEASPSNDDADLGPGGADRVVDREEGDYSWDSGDSGDREDVNGDDGRCDGDDDNSVGGTGGGDSRGDRGTSAASPRASRGGSRRFSSLLSTATRPRRHPMRDASTWSMKFNSAAIERAFEMQRLRQRGDVHIACYVALALVLVLRSIQCRTQQLGSGGTVEQNANIAAADCYLLLAGCVAAAGAISRTKRFLDRWSFYTVCIFALIEVFDGGMLLGRVAVIRANNASAVTSAAAELATVYFRGIGVIVLLSAFSGIVFRHFAVLILFGIATGALFTLAVWFVGDVLVVGSQAAASWFSSVTTFVALSVVTYFRERKERTNFEISRAYRDPALSHTESLQQCGGGSLEYGSQTYEDGSGNLTTGIREVRRWREGEQADGTASHDMVPRRARRARPSKGKFDLFGRVTTSQGGARTVSESFPMMGGTTIAAHIAKKATPGEREILSRVLGTTADKRWATILSKW